jgi:reverse gyrase
VHPSHIAIFAERTAGHWLQVYQKFLDGMSYNEQLELVNHLCEFYQVDAGAYDATRGELESFAERKELHQSLEPIVFKLQTKHDMATNFEKMVENKEIELLNDRRMLDQILVVDNDLQALETPEGHGDSFWSIAMALWMAAKKTDSWDEPIR